MSFISEIKRHPAFGELPPSFRRWLGMRFLFGKKPEKTGNGYFLSMHLPLFPSEAFDRFLWAQVDISKGKKVLEIASIEVTRRCAYDCRHCAFPKAGMELSASQIGKILEQIKELRPYSYIITGGDPLERDDLEAIISHIKGEGAVNISTPGKLLTYERALSLKNAGATGVFIGIDSPYEDRNDSIKGVKGAYRKALEAVENGKKAGLFVGISSVMMPDSTRKELMDLIALGTKLGVHEIDLFEAISPSKGLYGAQSLEKDLFRVQKKARRKWPVIISGPYMDSPEFMGCTAGFNRIHMDYRGKIMACSVMPYSVGSALEEPVKDLWERMYSPPTSVCLAKECIRKKISGSACISQKEGGMPAYYSRLTGERK